MLRRARQTFVLGSHAVLHAFPGASGLGFPDSLATQIECGLLRSRIDQLPLNHKVHDAKYVGRLLEPLVREHFFPSSPYYPLLFDLLDGKDKSLAEAQAITAGPWDGEGKPPFSESRAWADDTLLNSTMTLLEYLHMHRVSQVFRTFRSTQSYTDSKTNVCWSLPRPENCSALYGVLFNFYKYLMKKSNTYQLGLVNGDANIRFKCLLDELSRNCTNSMLISDPDGALVVPTWGCILEPFVRMLSECWWIRIPLSKKTAYVQLAEAQQEAQKQPAGGTRRSEKSYSTVFEEFSYSEAVEVLTNPEKQDAIETSGTRGLSMSANDDDKGSATARRKNLEAGRSRRGSVVGSDPIDGGAGENTSGGTERDRVATTTENYIERIVNDLNPIFRVRSISTNGNGGSGGGKNSTIHNMTQIPMGNVESLNNTGGKRNSLSGSGGGNASKKSFASNRSLSRSLSNSSESVTTGNTGESTNLQPSGGGKIPRKASLSGRNPNRVSNSGGGRGSISGSSDNTGGNNSPPRKSRIGRSHSLPGMSLSLKHFEQLLPLVLQAIAEGNLPSHYLTSLIGASGLGNASVPGIPSRFGEGMSTRRSSLPPALSDPVAASGDHGNGEKLCPQCRQPLPKAQKAINQLPS